MKFSWPLLVLDVETTGTDEYRHDICEIGAVLLSKRLDELDSFKSYVRPSSGDRDPKAMSVHKIPNTVLLDAPSFHEVVEGFVEMLAKYDSAMPMLTGWGVEFDQRFLVAGFKKAGLSYPFGHRIFDVRTIFNWEAGCLEMKYNPEMGKGLSDAMSVMGLEFAGTPHNALADAKNTATLLRHLAQRRSER